jgi:hypothetical protein
VSAQPLEQYRRLMNELLIEREKEGGELLVEVESAYVERLDYLWGQLSDEEQTTCEAELANAPAPAGPEDLDLVDCDVERGAAPRRAA